MLTFDELHMESTCSCKISRLGRQAKNPLQMLCPVCSAGQVVLAGEFEGEDLPLYDIELRYKGGLKNALLHPNQPGPAHKLEEGQVGQL